MMSEQGRSITLENVFDEIISAKNEIISTKNELRNSISASETRLLLEITELKSKVSHLERENETLRVRLERVERSSNKKNLIIFGIGGKTTDITADNLCQKLSNLLDIKIKGEDVSDFYPLGRSDESPLKVELVSYSTKRAILSNAKKLKGTGISIKSDLTSQQRDDLGKLKKHLTEARANYSCISYIKGRTLVIGEEVYTLDELEQQEITKRPNSAPETPIRVDNATEIEHSHEEIILNEPSAVAQASNKTPTLKTHAKNLLYLNRASPGLPVTRGMKLRNNPTKQ